MTQKTLSTIENQYGDFIPAAVLYQESGMLYLWEINCLSALDYGLGHCHCVNHPMAIEYPISTHEIINQFGKEALDGFNEPGDAQLVFDAFGVEINELETFLRLSYRFGMNPLPVLRAQTECAVVFSENPDYLSFPGEEPGTTIFVVNGRGEISVVTVEGRQTYEEVNISTEPDPDEEAATPEEYFASGKADDPVGTPSLAIPGFVK